MVRREVRRPFTQFLKPGHFYALGTDRFYVSNNMEVLVMYDSYYDKDSIFKRMTFNEETYILIRDFLDKINNNDYNDIDGGVSFLIGNYWTFNYRIADICENFEII